MLVPQMGHQSGSIQMNLSSAFYMEGLSQGPSPGGPSAPLSPV